MTLKLEALAKELPKQQFNVNKAARKIGYSEYYSNSGIYRRIRKSKAFKNYFDEVTVKKELRLALKKCKSEKDYTNVLRAIELMSKILGLQLDRSEVNQKGASQTIIVDNTGRFNKQDTENKEVIKQEEPAKLT